MQSFQSFEDTLLPWLGRINKEFSFLVQSTFDQHQIDLTRHQWLVLKKLIENDGQPQNNLAFITDRDKTSLTRLINTMERKNLVLRIPDISDKRINNVFISDKGKAVLESSIPLMHELVERLQGGLSKGELEQTIKILRRVRYNLEDHHIKNDK